METQVIIISDTAVQKGFGSDRYKRVIGVTKEEKKAIVDGQIVAFKSALSGGTHGTPWRVVRLINGRLYPRVPSPELLKMIESGFALIESI